MASINIHLAIGKRYIEKTNSITNKLDFYKGIIAPDFTNDKRISHYKGFQSKINYYKYFENNVQLNEFLKKENIDTDYQKGIFLHLITDYLFFNTIFDINYLENTSYQDFIKDLYYSYINTNNYIENKYKLEYYDFYYDIKKNIETNIKKKNITNEIRTNILPIYKLDNFIEYVSNIDLETYKQKIIYNNKNVLPD